MPSPESKSVRSLIKSPALLQVGLDAKAQAFLSRLDNDSKVGKMVDCTSAYELEQEEYLQRSGEDSRCLIGIFAQYSSIQGVDKLRRANPASSISTE